MRHLEEHKRIVPADGLQAALRAVREDDARQGRDRSFANGSCATGTRDSSIAGRRAQAPFGLLRPHR